MLLPSCSMLKSKFRSQLKGVSNVKFLMFRLALLYALKKARQAGISADPKIRLSGNFWLVFLQINIFAYLCIMKPEQLLRAILPDVLIDNFDIVSFDKSADRFDIYLDEKKVQLKEDKYNPEIIAYGFGEYRVIQDYPIRGRATYLHVRKRKWLDKSSNEIFSYDWDLSEFDGTRLNSEFVSFLKEGD